MDVSTNPISPNSEAENGTKVLQSPLVNPAPKVSLKEKLKKLWQDPRKRALLIFGALLVVFGGGFITYAVIRSRDFYADPQNLINPDLVVEQGKTTLDGYDLVYLGEDKELYATTEAAEKKIQITKSESGVVDYVISPDKAKIAYTVAHKDYKDKLKSTWKYLSRFKVDPVPTSIYEYDVVTGKNKLLWSVDTINLIAPQDESYYPDDYLVEEWVDYRPNYNQYGQIVSYASYPMSYVRRGPVSFPESRYNYLPYDVRNDLTYKQPKLLTYSDDSSKLLFTAEGANVLDLVSEKTTKLEGGSSQNYVGACNPHSGLWESGYIILQFSCTSAEEKVLHVENNTYTTVGNDVLNITRVTGDIQETDRVFGMAADKAVLLHTNYDWKQSVTKQSFRTLDLQTNALEELVNVFERENIISTLTQNLVTKDGDIFFITTDGQAGKHVYKFNLEDKEVIRINDINIGGYTSIYNYSFDDAREKLLMTAPQSNPDGGYKWSILVYNLQDNSVKVIESMTMGENTGYEGYVTPVNFRGAWVR